MEGVNWCGEFYGDPEGPEIQLPGQSYRPPLHIHTSVHNALGLHRISTFSKESQVS